jgi:hypothetical protein
MKTSHKSDELKKKGGENLNSDCQQFHQYQQKKKSLNSDGQQFHQYQIH